MLALGCLWQIYGRQSTIRWQWAAWTHSATVRRSTWRSQRRVWWSIIFSKFIDDECSCEYDRLQLRMSYSRPITTLN